MRRQDNLCGPGAHGKITALQQGRVDYNSVPGDNTVTLADGSGAVFQAPPVAPACRRPGGHCEEFNLSSAPGGGLPA